MLCENLQRNDLTYYEQGQGFQMMLDLGDDIDAIEEKTGFSKTIEAHRKMIEELKTIGFFIPVEIDEDLVTGKSDMYAKLENLRS